MPLTTSRRPTTPFRLRPSRATAQVAAGLILVVLACALYWATLLHDHKVQHRLLEEQTRLRVSQVARAISVQVGTLFAGLDNTTRTLSAAYGKGDHKSFLAAVRSVEQTMPPGAVQLIAVADAQGRIVYSSLEPNGVATPLSVADRDHFIVHALADAPQQSLFIGRPVEGRISRRWGIPLSSAIMRDGRFAGTVLLSLSPTYIASFFRDVFDQPHDVVLLVRDDGTYLARSEQEASVLGGMLPPSRGLVTEQGRAYGDYEATATVDGVRRYYAWSRTPGYPMVVSAGLDQQAAFAPLEPVRHTSLVRSSVSTAVVLASALLVAWLSLQRRRNRALLAEGEARLRKLVAQVPGALFQLRVRPGGSPAFPFASPALLQLHRLQGGIPDPRALLPLLHREDARRVVASIAASARQLQPWDCKYRLRFADGEERWLHGHANPERTADGGTLWHGFIHDVTVEHGVEAALRASEERLRMTVDAVQDGLWQWSIADDSLQWDARCYAMLGYDGEPFVRTFAGFDAILHPRDRDRMLSELRGHLDEGRDYRVEFRLRTADGGWLWVESRGEVTARDRQGRPLRMLGTHGDISQRVESEHLVRALLDQSSAVIFVASPTRRVVHANERAQQVFGNPGEPLVGQDFRIIHPADDSFDHTADAYAELRRQGWTRLEIQLRVRGGALHWFEAHGTLLDPGDPEGDVIWTMFDTTGRHTAQAALSLAQQRLTALIARFPDGVLLDDPAAGRIVAVNAALCAQLQLQAQPAALADSPRDALAALLTPEAAALLLPAQPLADDRLGTELALPQGTVLEIDQIALQAPGMQLGRLSIVRDVTARRRRESTLELLATTDTLTGLPNRRAFMARLQQECDDVRSGRQPPSVVMMLDIDHFKQVNDTWGHAAGDEVLRHLAAVIGRNLRRDDLAGRLGGEEFAILLSHTGPSDGFALAERLRQALAGGPAPSAAGDIAFTVSFGLSVLGAGTAGPEACLAQADAALYHSKHHGRNRVTAWAPGMDMAKLAQPTYSQDK